MTGLFDRVKKDTVQLESVAYTLSNRLDKEDAKEVEQVAPSQTGVPIVPSQSVDFGESDEITFGGEKTPTDAILDMAGDDTAFAVKGVAPNPSGFSAAQIQADYHEELFGVDNIASKMLRDLCLWQSRYNSSGKKGERAKQVFGALGTAKQEEFTLEKEAKGLMR